MRTAPFEASLGVRIYPMKTRSLALNLGAAAPLTSGVGAGLIRVLFGLVWSPEAVPDTDGDGLTDDKDRCPKTKGPKENKGCPWPDTDGDGLKDNIDKCPKLPGPQANKGCPWGDKDRDGVKDNVDRCPEKPGPQANQGCPWPDTDGDGITDNIDKCPKRKGPRENKGCPWPDTDGDGVTDNIDKCPQIRGPAINKGCPLAIKKKKKIMITQKIFFDFNKSSIKRISYPVIDAVVNILRKYPNLRIRIEGHTDDVGDAKSNLSLSKRRARSVLQYMLRKKVAKIRMTYQGFGKSRPLVQSKSKEARSKNRRVEFVITQQ